MAEPIGVLRGHAEIVAFLTRKWEREHEYVLRKSLWAWTGNHIAVRFQYEWHDDAGQWWRCYGNENWDFDPFGYMSRREASINDAAITADERRLLGPRPPEEREALLPLQQGTGVKIGGVGGLLAAQVVTRSVTRCRAAV